jgi:hypothetical protein
VLDRAEAAGLIKKESPGYVRRAGRIEAIFFFA